MINHLIDSSTSLKFPTRKCWKKGHIFISHFPKLIEIYESRSEHYHFLKKKTLMHIPHKRALKKNSKENSYEGKGTVVS